LVTPETRVGTFWDWGHTFGLGKFQQNNFRPKGLNLGKVNRQILGFHWEKKGRK